MNVSYQRKAAQPLSLSSIIEMSRRAMSRARYNDIVIALAFLYAITRPWWIARAVLAMLVSL